MKCWPRGNEILPACRDVRVNFRKFCNPHAVAVVLARLTPSPRAKDLSSSSDRDRQNDASRRSPLRIDGSPSVQSSPVAAWIPKHPLGRGSTRRAPIAVQRHRARYYWVLLGVSEPSENRMVLCTRHWQPGAFNPSPREQRSPGVNGRDGRGGSGGR